MTLPDHEFDPDDNYTSDPERAEIDDDASAEALVWQLLLVINPGDEQGFELRSPASPRAMITR